MVFQLFPPSHNFSCRILESLDTLALSIEIPTNGSNGTVVLAQENFAIVVQDIDPSTFTGEAFSADLGPVDGTMEGVSGNINENNLVRMADVIANATASVQLPESFFDESGNETERIYYAIFLSDTLFLTPDTTCPNGSIASIIVTVQVNGSSTLNGNITFNFQQLGEVSSTDLGYGM